MLSARLLLFTAQAELCRSLRVRPRFKLRQVVPSGIFRIEVWQGLPCEGASNFSPGERTWIGFYSGNSYTKRSAGQDVHGTALASEGGPELRLRRWDSRQSAKPNGWPISYGSNNDGG